MAAPSVTYTFSNSTTADATEVNTNFTDIINGLSDGTKDLTISAITAGGTATLNGDITLGSSSSDTLTVNASLGSSIALSADGTHDLGSATAGMRALYIGDGSGNTVKLYAGTGMSGDYNFRFPDDDGLVGQPMISDGSGLLTWDFPKEIIASKSGAYTATASESFIRVDTSGGAVTITLPAAASHTGRRFTVIKTTSDTSAVTVDANGAELIKSYGATTNIQFAGQWESVTVVSDGTDWYVMNFHANQKIETTLSGTDSTSAADTYVDVGSDTITLIPGKWEIGYDTSLFMDYNGGGTTAFYGNGAILTSGGSTVSGSISVCYVNSADTTHQFIFPISRSVVVTPTSDTTYKFSIRCSSASTNAIVQHVHNDFTALLTNDDNSATLWARRLG